MSDVAPHPSAPEARANPELLGHETAERSLRRLLDSGRLPHAILIGGPRGIGKATLAYRLARFVFSRSAPTGEAVDSERLAVAAESGVFRRVASGGHADLLTVERAYDPRRRRLRSEIVVEDVREIAAFLHLTPAESGWRVVIVDGADEMNRNAANALLKILEEPPRRTVVLLVAHSPGRLLPTIRSRCRRLSLSALPAAIVLDLLGRYRPGLASTDAEAIAGLANGSIGTALDIAAAGGLDLYRSLVGLLARPNLAELHAFADRLARSEAEDSYRLVQESIGQILTRLARKAAGTETGGTMMDEAAIERLAGRAHAAAWATLRDEIGARFGRADGLNLDRKQALLGAFFAIERAAG